MFVMSILVQRTMLLPLFQTFIAIVEWRFNDCKHMVEVERMQLGSMRGKNANWDIDCVN
jgi:hypothetical protein